MIPRPLLKVLRMPLPTTSLPCPSPLTRAMKYRAVVGMRPFSPLTGTLNQSCPLWNKTGTKNTPWGIYEGQQADLGQHNTCQALFRVRYLLIRQVPAVSPRPEMALRCLGVPTWLNLCWVTCSFGASSGSWEINFEAGGECRA